MCCVFVSGLTSNIKVPWWGNYLLHEIFTDGWLHMKQAGDQCLLSISNSQIFDIQEGPLLKMLHWVLKYHSLVFFSFIFTFCVYSKQHFHSQWEIQPRRESSYRYHEFQHIPVYAVAANMFWGFTRLWAHLASILSWQQKQCYHHVHNIIKSLQW